MECTNVMAEGSSRWLWFLSLSLVLLVVVVGVVVYDRLIGPTVPTPVSGVADDQVSARQAFALAAEVAGQWQEDARLAAVSGYRPAVGMQAGGQVEWAFQFFSAAAQQLALITVADGRARMVRESVSPYAVPTFSAEEWRVDSDQALRAWWSQGGETLAARRPDVDVTMQLRVPDGGVGHPVWTVVGSVAGTETAFAVVVDATDGALVEP
jgi:hypothetical protein